MPKPIHLIFLIHGIRDRAAWRSHVADALAKDGFKVCPCGYGYFDLFRFWWPLKTRLIPVALVERQIRGYKAREEHKGNVVTMSAIAHSFGTYILSQILQEATDLHWERIIFCGAIVPEMFRWDKVSSQVDPEKVINDVGNRDIWPGMAKFLSFGYGDAGSHGFAADVVDRFQDSGHSDYLKGDFPSKFWAPWIHSGTLVRPDKPATSSRLAGWLGTAGLNFIGFTVVAVLILALLGLVLGLPLAIATRTWWAVYLFSTVLGLGALLLLPKYRYGLAAICLIVGVTIGTRFLLGTSSFHVDPKTFAGVVADANWDDNGRLALSVDEVPDDATMLPNRLRIDVVQGSVEKMIKSELPGPPARMKIIQLIDGFQKQSPVELRFRVSDQNGALIDDRSFPITIQEAR